MTKNIICWFEIYVDDIERAKKFYQQVLGCSFENAPAINNDVDTKMAFFPGDPQGEGVSGALIQMQGARTVNGNTSTIVYFPCEDCSVEESRVTTAGGKVHQTKMSLGEFGYCSICIDSEGNTFGLHSME